MFSLSGERKRNVVKVRVTTVVSGRCVCVLHGVWIQGSFNFRLHTGEWIQQELREWLLSFWLMQITQQWGAAEFSRAASCESMWLITCLPVVWGFPVTEDLLCQGERADGGNAKANEFSFNHDGVYIKLTEKSEYLRIRLQALLCFKFTSLYYNTQLS